MADAAPERKYPHGGDQPFAAPGHCAAAGKIRSGRPAQLSKKGVGMLGARDVPLLGIYVVWETANVLMIGWAKDPTTNQAAYSPPMLILACEITKFAISSVQLRSAGFSTADVDWQQNWKFAVPAMLYCMTNNLFVYILRIIPGSVFQMLCNLRSLYTGILFYYFLGRKLSMWQWGALVLLVMGTSLCQYANMDDMSHLRVSQVGVLLSLLYGILSVAAGVWSELLLKRGTKSIHLENAQLYFYGIVINSVSVLVTESAGGQSPGQLGGVLRGWNLWSTWALCINMAATGIICSAVLKYYDNLVKIFCVTMSNFVVYSFNLFIIRDQTFHPLFLAGLLLVALALYFYNSPVQDKLGQDSESSGSQATLDAAPNLDCPRKDIEMGPTLVSGKTYTD